MFAILFSFVWSQLVRTKIYSMFGTYFCNNSVYIYAHFSPCLTLIFVTIQFAYMLYSSCLALILFHVSQMSSSGSEDSSHDDDEHFFLSFKVVLN
jgi:hypothetical protein